jgi:hypothetical protein
MRGLVAIAAVVVLAATVGTAVYAMVEDEADPPSTFASRRAAEDALRDGSSVAAICALDVRDCDDTVVEGGGGFAQCATEEPCGDFDEKCAADACGAPMLAPELVCTGGASIEECFPGGVPAGYECVTLESFPVQVNCYTIGCAPVDGPVTILPVPAPGEPTIVEEPQVDPADPGIAVGEPVPPTDVCVTPPVDCETDPSVVHCLPIDDRCSPEPDANVRCLPPDCAISSDGSVYCPKPLPEPCIDPSVGVPGAELEPCSEPGDPGVCVPGPAVDCGVICPDRPDLAPEDCVIEPEGGGTDGSTGDGSTE